VPVLVPVVVVGIELVEGVDMEEVEVEDIEDEELLDVEVPATLWAL